MLHERDKSVTWEQLKRRQDKSNPKAVRQLRAAVWVDSISYKTGERNQADYLDALKGVIRGHVSSHRDELTTFAIGTRQVPNGPGSSTEIADGDNDPVLLPPGFNRLWRNQRVRIALMGTGALLLVAFVVVMSMFVARNRPIYVDPKITVVAPQPGITRAPRVQLDNSHGWGPDRPTFTDQVPADHPVFNSITNSAVHGDERSFLSCWDKTKGSTVRDNELVADDGHTYGCVVEFDNDIADNLDNGTPATELTNAKVALTLPETSLYNPGMTAFLSSGTTGPVSSNNPGTVWASTNFVSSRPMRIIYQPDSARMYTNGTSKDGLQFAENHNGDVITSGIATSSGALLGYDRQDGIVRHSYQYSGYVVFEVKVVLDPPAN